MNKKEEYLKFYIDSNGNIDTINKYIKKEHINLNEFNDIVRDYLIELENNKNKSNKMNKLYIEYCLKYGKKIPDNKRIGKRKETETVLNIINNYINEDKHNIKEYIELSNLTYEEFKKFINNYKNYYLSDKEKLLLKKFFKREIHFNEDNLETVKKVVDKISEDLVGNKTYNIYDYYKELGWDDKLLIYYLKNNNNYFSNFIIDNVSLYIKKYQMNKNYKLNEFIEYIKKHDDNENMNNIINYIQDNNMPYNYCLYKIIKDTKIKK